MLCPHDVLVTSGLGTQDRMSKSISIGWCKITFRWNAGNREPLMSSCFIPASLKVSSTADKDNPAKWSLLDVRDKVHSKSGLVFDIMRSEQKNCNYAGDFSNSFSWQNINKSLFKFHFNLGPTGDKLLLKTISTKINKVIWRHWAAVS